MPKRAVSNKVHQWLVGELETWQREEIVSPEQSSRILALYETPSEVADRRQSLAMITLMGLAAVMVGLAALLLVGYNWDAMPAVVKLTLIFGSILVAHGVGFHLRYQRGHKIASEVAFLLGCLFYGVGIWQVAQIFHIQSHYPNGIWIWAVAVLPMALCLETPLLHVLFAGLMAIWAGTEILGFGELGMWFFGRWHALSNGAYSLPLLAAPGVLWAYRKRSVATVAVYVPLLAWWIVLQPFAWDWETCAVFFIGAVGGLLLLVSQVHPQGSPLRVIYRLYGVLMAAGVLVPMSFYEFNKEIFHWHPWKDYQVSGLLAAPAIVALSIVVIGLAAFFSRQSTERRASLPDSMMAIVRGQWLPLGFIFLMAVLPALNTILIITGDNPALAALLTTVSANLAMMVLAVWLIHIGLDEDRGQPFAAGVIYFLLWAVFRYIDLFADFGGMLGAALMFFLVGAALFGMAIFWRKRKEIRHG